MANPLIAALDTVGRIEAHVQEIANLEKQLETVPLWQPAAVLKKQARQACRMIHDLQERIEGRLVVTLIGPSGAGKSTLFNALAGEDQLSPVGAERPTTRDLVVLADDPQATRQLLGSLDHEEINIQSGPAAEKLEHLILVDTPDTDTTRSPKYIELLHRIVSRSDVLICVFDAQNPKRRDHADFMAPLVQRFNGASLVAVVNKCDRHDESELTHSIGPDFDAWLQQAWPIHPEYLLLISARRHLKDPRWDPQAEPRHSLDQFDQLQALVKSTLNRPDAGQDRRVANAGQIKDYLMAQVTDRAARHESGLAKAAEQIASVEHNALQSALPLLGADEGRQILGIQVRLYQALAQRWLGPVGWLVAIWSRLIVFGSGLTALVRFGNPLRQLWGAVTSLKRLKESRSALDLLTHQPRVDRAMDGFRKSLLTQWPDIVETLIRQGFDPATHHLGALEQNTDDMTRALDSLWSDALDGQINRYARGLSHLLLQVLFNLPGVALMGYVGWLTVSGFFRGHYLSSDFFLHAVLTIALVLLLSFFLFQVVVRLAAGRDRVQRQAFEAMEKAASKSPLVATRNVAEQVAQVRALARLTSARPNAAQSAQGGEGRL